MRGHPLSTQLPAGMMENERGVFESRPGLYWHPVAIANKDGRTMINYALIRCIGVRCHVEALIRSFCRVRSAPESDGCWRSGGESVADDYLNGWFAYSVPLTEDGRLIQPHDAYARMKA